MIYEIFRCKERIEALNVFFLKGHRLRSYNNNELSGTKLNAYLI